MIKALILAGAVATVSPLVVEGQRSPLSDPLIVRGRDLVRGHCVGCHSAQPTGLSPLAAAPPFRIMRSLNPLVLQRVALEVGRFDHAGMPSIVLTTAEAESIAAYVRALAKADPKTQSSLSVQPCLARRC
jgi:cytochrome c